MACARSESIFCCPRAFADFFRELDRFPEAAVRVLDDFPLDEVLRFVELAGALVLAAGLAEAFTAESC